MRRDVVDTGILGDGVAAGLGTGLSGGEVAMAEERREEREHNEYKVSCGKRPSAYGGLLLVHRALAG